MYGKFLHKVVDQIVRESIVDYIGDEITYPVNLSIQVFYETPFASYPVSTQFVRHCEEVYGLNKEETEYVWRHYKTTMRIEGKL